MYILKIIYHFLHCINPINLYCYHLIVKDHFPPKNSYIVIFPYFELNDVYHTIKNQLNQGHIPI